MIKIHLGITKAFFLIGDQEEEWNPYMFIQGTHSPKPRISMPNPEVLDL